MTRTRRARRYNKEPRLIKLPGRKGMFIRWVERRWDEYAFSFTPSPDTPQLDVSADKLGVRLQSPPPESHPLRDQLHAGDLITHLLTPGVIRYRIRTQLDLERALAAQSGQRVEIYIRRGPAGHTFRYMAAGSDPVYQTKLLNRFRAIYSSTRNAALRQKLIADFRRDPDNAVTDPSAVTFGQIATAAIDWAHKRHVSGYSPQYAARFSSALRRFTRMWGDRPAHELTTNFIRNYLDGRIAGGTAPATVKVEHRVLRSAFSLAVEQRLIAADPTSDIRPPRVPNDRAIILLQRRYLTREEASAFLQTALDIDTARLTRKVSGLPRTTKTGADLYGHLYNTHTRSFDHARIMFLLYTAIRRGELVSLRWSDWDASNNCLLFEQKGRRPRSLPLPPEAVKILQGQPRTSAFIFPGLRGQRDATFHVRFDVIAREYERRGGRHVCPHMLRHTALTLFLSATGNMAATSKYAGHARVSTTEIYSKILESDLAEYAKRFDPLAPNPPKTVHP